MGWQCNSKRQKNGKKSKAQHQTRNEIFFRRRLRRSDSRNPLELNVNISLLFRVIAAKTVVVVCSLVQHRMPHWHIHHSVAFVLTVNFTLIARCGAWHRCEVEWRIFHGIFIGELCEKENVTRWWKLRSFESSWKAFKFKIISDYSRDRRKVPTDLIIVTC